ncbi:MAG: GNAT family N-acetyltransferase [Flavobacteriaceae bacterium]|nr:GNAT family N-acetyltransferase [Flavobacteriaceae bacterium]
MCRSYIFTSERLGFRNWKRDDLEDFAAINADFRVMEYFPFVLNKADTKASIQSYQEHYDTYGYNYFAVETLSNKEFIGFIGMAFQTYKSKYTPATDIGWRLKPSAWGNGYATEGAKRCLEYAFKALELERVIAICTINNINSERVMQKIGMTKLGNFKHPKLKDYPDYEDCLCYEIGL